jgi:hypothetical protein
VEYDQTPARQRLPRGSHPDEAAALVLDVAAGKLPLDEIRPRLRVVEHD